MRARVFIVTLVAATALALGLGLGSAGASPTCTDNFTGSSGGAWDTAGNWSSGVPGASTVACIPSAVTVDVAGTDQAEVIQGTASTPGSVDVTTGVLTLGASDTSGTSQLSALSISGGAVEVDDTLDESGDLTVSGGSTLAGPGTLNLTGNFLWNGQSGINGGITINQTGSGTFAITGTGQNYLSSASITTTSPVAISDTDFITASAALTTTSTVTFAPGTYQANGGAGATITASGFITTAATTIQNYALHLTGNNSSLAGSLTSTQLLNTDAATTLTVPTGVTLSIAGGTISGTLTGHGTLNQTGGTLTVASGATLATDNVTASGGLLNVPSGATYDPAGSTTISGAAVTITPTTATTGDLTVSGGSTLAGPGTLNLTGNFLWNGQSGINGGITINQTGSGTFAITGTGQNYLSSAAITTAAPVTISDTDFITAGNATLTTSGTIALAGGLDIPVNGGDNATFTAAGVAANSGPTYGFGADSLVLTGGTTAVASGKTLDSGPITISGGTLQDDGQLNGAVTLSGGTLSGTGQVPGISNTSGTVQPGDGGSPGTLSVQNGFTQGSGGTLAIPAGGTGAGQASELDVAGPLTLDGTLLMEPTNGYVSHAAAGDTFDVISYGGALAGTFAQTDSAPPLNPGQAFSANYLTGSRLVQAVVSGAHQTAPGNTSLPAISGTPSPGDALTCSPGSWTGNPAPTYTYTWNRDGSPIATGSSYTVQTADQGHALTCTVKATNAAGSASATSAGVNVPSPPPPPGKPVNTEPPHISVPPGGAVPGSTLNCSSGSWTGNPTSFTYQWERAGVPIPGATSDTYKVQIADEASELVCVVTAHNAAGGVASPPVLVSVPGTLTCPKPSGRITGLSVGPLAIGMRQRDARRLLRRFHALSYGFDDYCLFAGFGIRAGYPTAGLLRELPARLRRAVAGRIVIALTANPYYSLGGVRPGMTLAQARRILHLGRAFHLGPNYWYLVAGRRATGVLKVRGGIVAEIGLADIRLTRGSRAAQLRFLRTIR